MPIPVAAAIAAGVTLAGQGANAIAQGKMNRRTLAYNREMFGLQAHLNKKNWEMENERNDMVWNRQNEKNIEMWRMENEYNSPRAQMQRFQEAGLNPNLIYGQQNTGGSIATGNPDSGSIGSTNPGSWNPQAPQFDLQQGLLAYNAFRESSARIDNMEQITKNLRVDNTLKVLDVTGKNLENAKGHLSLRQMQELYSTQVDAQKVALDKLKAETDLIYPRFDREGRLNDATLSKIAQEISTMKTTEQTQRIQQYVLQLQAKLAELGISDRAIDPILGIKRMLGPAVNEAARDFNQSWKNLGDRKGWRTR